MTYNNDINARTPGLINASGTGTFTGAPVTNHNLLLGAASNGITSVAPSATSGVPVISQGASADLAFGTMIPAAGGTGITSGTAYGVVCAGTTSTGNFQVVTPGTSGYLLTANGSSALPTWVAPPSGNLILIQSQTVSAVTAVNFTTGITSTYNNYFFLLSNITMAGTPVLGGFTCQYSINGGSSYVTTNYPSVSSTLATNSTTWLASVAGNLLTIPDTSVTGTTGFSAYLYNLTSGTGYIAASGKGVTSDTTAATTVYLIAAGANTASNLTVNALRWVISGVSATFSGTFSLFGILQ